MNNIVDECIQDPKYAKGREKARGETWEYKDEGTKCAVDYLIDKYEELQRAAEEKVRCLFGKY